MIGDFDYIEAYTSGAFDGERVPCRVYAPVGLADQGHYSLDLAVKVWKITSGMEDGVICFTLLTARDILRTSVSNISPVCSIYPFHYQSWTW